MKHGEGEVNKRKISRRTFVAGAAAGALAAPALRARAFVSTQHTRDIAVAGGADAAANARAAVEALGGMGHFVSPGQTVALLPNVQIPTPGASIDLAIVRTVADMCREAGATEVRWLTWYPQRFWDRLNLHQQVVDCGAVLVYSDHENAGQWATIEVPRGVILRQIRVIKSLYESDVFINMPISKHHAGSSFTCSLKNYMGASHPEDNRPFHPTYGAEYAVHMGQCIADLNTAARPADLYIADAMEVLTSNGPMGPGDVARPQRVVAGTDRVAVDSYCAALLGLNATEIHMIRLAHQHGLGQIDLSSLNISEIETG